MADHDARDDGADATDAIPGGALDATLARQVVFLCEQLDAVETPERERLGRWDAHQAAPELLWMIGKQRPAALTQDGLAALIGAAVLTAAAEAEDVADDEPAAVHCEGALALAGDRLLAALQERLAAG
jgi:hypothetical protein